MTIPETTEPSAREPSAREPSGGWFEGRCFAFPIRVYYEDTDLSGVVYHATYLRFMERGRSEFLRASGTRHQGMLDAEEPLVWAIRRAAIEYIRPARVDEALIVRTQVQRLSPARMWLDQTIYRGEEVLTRGEVEACVITLDGKPRRIPGGLMNKLERFVAV